ncbi:hypothetical protein ACIQ4Z_19830 [Peribacillus asahii]
MYLGGGNYSDEDTSYYEIPDDWYGSKESYDEKESKSKVEEHY